MALHRSSQDRSYYLVAAIEEDVYCPVSYVRVVHHLQNAPKGWASSLFVLARDVDKARAELPKASGLFLARATSPEAVALAGQARQLGLPVIYDIDDYLWRLPDYVAPKDLAGGVDAVLEHATLVLTPSEVLRGFVRNKFPDLPVTIVPNAGDIFCQRPRRREIRAVLANSDFFRIPSMKAEFFQAIRDGATESGVKLYLYYLSNDVPEVFTDDPNLAIIWCGVRSYSSYRELLDSLNPEIALIPLADDHFSQYKSVVKFAEFGRNSTAGIYSRVEPYRSFVRDGRDGWLSDNTPESWRKTVAHVLSLNPFELDLVRNSARARSRKEFRGDEIRATLFAALQGAELRPVSGATPIQPPPPEGEFVFREAYDYCVGRWAASESADLKTLETNKPSHPQAENRTGRRRASKS